MTQKTHCFFVLLLLISFSGVVVAQEMTDMHLSKDYVTRHEFDASVEFLLVEISSNHGYYFSQQVENTGQIQIANRRSDGQKFQDGQYSMQVTPIVSLDKHHKDYLANLRHKGEETLIKEYLAAHGLPTAVSGLNVNFSIADGAFVMDDRQEYNFRRVVNKRDRGIVHPELYASLTYMPASISSNTAVDEWFEVEEDQVILDDLIVSGSTCIGVDCANGESFGFSTLRLKENNLRIEFDDTSVSASFPRNDWMIVINDSNNGGGSHFSIDDVTGGTTPFRIMAGAGNHALHVSSNSGNVGLGTNAPALELHITDGNSPAIRLDQNGTSGFAPHVWDIAANESNFIIRDVTNASALPFRILSGSDDNTISINNGGRIGFGIETSAHGFHFKDNDMYLDGGKLGIGKVPTSPLDVVGTAKILGDQIVTGTSTVRGDMNALLTTGAIFNDAAGNPVMGIDAVNVRVGIGTTSPDHQLELTQDDAVKPGGGMWSAPSDRRLKSDIQAFTDGLSTLKAIEPVTFKYNEVSNYPQDQRHIGVIAQEVQPVAPYAVKNLDDKYLAVDPSSFTYILINAVKEQQKTIETQQREINELKKELSSVADIKKQLGQLSAQLNSLLESEKETSVRPSEDEK